MVKKTLLDFTVSLDGKIYPLDGDIYYDDFKVIGFEEFQNIPMGVNTGIDILVGDDW
jgi:hypothetical protein